MLFEELSLPKEKRFFNSVLIFWKVIG